MYDNGKIIHEIAKKDAPRDNAPIENSRPAVTKKEIIKREVSRAEKILLPVALLVAVLYDRIIIYGFIQYGWWSCNCCPQPYVFSAAFWLCYLVIFYVFYWKRLRENYVLWFVAAGSVALCLWSFIPSFNSSEFAVITFFVIPGVLMAHAQWLAGGFTLKKNDGIAVAWVLGWLVKPFSGISALVEATTSVASESSKAMVKRVVLGLVLASVLLIVIVPLLMGADRVFGYYVGQLLQGWNIASFIGHGIVITVAFGLFYSFLWNVGYGENKPYTISDTWKIDTVISGIALGATMLVYGLFCLVQFTYLFARAGLPAGMTYSEYAREGFAQTVAVCAINLLMFGVFLRFGEEKKFFTGMLGGLLALTGIMLISGAVRLNLYISVFGMTWLRLLSAWFIIYLAVVIGLCAFRLYKKEFPWVVLSGLVLLAWYVVLGYLNPDGFISWYNSVGAFSSLVG